MDLGINGRRAIVCASSRGLGKACAMSLAAEGVAVVMNGRDAGTLKAAVDEVRAAAGAVMERNFGRIVNITSAAVKAPIPALGLSNGARAGLTGFVAGVAREVAAHGVTINNILPGPFDTDRLRANFRYNAEQSGGDAEALMAAGRRANPARRFGEPPEFGRLCAFLCSVHAGFINGQNIVVDGGAFPGTL